MIELLGFDSFLLERFVGLEALALSSRLAFILSLGRARSQMAVCSSFSRAPLSLLSSAGQASHVISTADVLPRSHSKMLIVAFTSMLGEAGVSIVVLLVASSCLTLRLP